MEHYGFEDDRAWVINLTRALQEDDFEDASDEELVSIVSIFQVPTALLSSKPEAHTPQVVALGPYHHRRLELLEMERYKLHSAKRVQKNLKKELKFHDLVDQIAKHDKVARACYHRHFNFSRERLAWLFAIDASFLLEYLRMYSTRSWEGSLTRVSFKMGHLIGHSQRKAMHQAILRDIIMLENQIPLFLVKEVHTFYQQEVQNKRYGPQC
ncbi:putative UPF0481 protein [Spatholobus suberectus]|nr:putative UPF0481 protein [Spatholobus suberectus]